MKAVIARGKDKGKVVSVSQWCNDWFSVTVEGRPKIVSPNTLIFSDDGMHEILHHKNNGNLLFLFEPVESNYQVTVEGESFIVTFKRNV